MLAPIFSFLTTCHCKSMIELWHHDRFTPFDAIRWHEKGCTRHRPRMASNFQHSWRSKLEGGLRLGILYSLISISWDARIRPWLQRKRKASTSGRTLRRKIIAIDMERTFEACHIFFWLFSGQQFKLETRNQRALPNNLMLIWYRAQSIFELVDWFR